MDPVYRPTRRLVRFSYVHVQADAPGTGEGVVEYVRTVGRANDEHAVGRLQAIEALEQHIGATIHRPRPRATVRAAPSCDLLNFIDEEDDWRLYARGVERTADVALRRNGRKPRLRHICSSCCYRTRRARPMTVAANDNSVIQDVRSSRRRTGFRNRRCHLCRIAAPPTWTTKPGGALKAPAGPSVRSLSRWSR